MQTKNLIISEIATVTSAYNAVTAEQLSLSPGQLILVKRKYPDGWWEGELQVSAKFNGFLLCCDGGYSCYLLSPPPPQKNQCLFSFEVWRISLLCSRLVNLHSTWLQLLVGFCMLLLGSGKEATKWFISCKSRQNPGQKSFWWLYNWSDS